MRRRQLLARLLFAAFLIGGWQLLAVRQGNPLLFPTLGYLLHVSLPSFGLFSLAGQPGVRDALAVLSENTAISAARILVGLIIGLPCGAAVGLLLHWVRGSGSTSTVTLIALRSIPLLALIPLFSFWFGSSTIGIIGYIAFGVFVVTLSDVYESAANVSPTLLSLAKLMGAGRFFMWRTVYVPSVMNHMLGSLRNVVGLCWALSLGAEYISAGSGLGYITYRSYLYSDMGKLSVLAILYVIAGYLSFKLVNQWVKALRIATSREVSTDETLDSFS